MTEEFQDQTGTEENPQEDLGDDTTAELEEATDGIEEVDSSESDSEGKSGVQKRIDELTAKRREAERDAEYWKEKATQAPPTQEPVIDVKRPKADDYDDYEEYIDALTDYKVGLAKKDILSSFEANTRKKTIEEKLNSFHESGTAKFDDFEETIERAAISEAMRDVLLESENGTDVSYYLGKNHAESVRIANLSPVLAAMELGKIEKQLEYEQKTPPGRKPINPLKSVQGKGGSGVTTVPDLNKDIPYDEWERLSALENG